MTAIKLEKFGGSFPLWDKRLVPDGQAVSLTNGYMLSGALQGWITPTKVRELNNPDANFVYRIPTIQRAAASAMGFFVTNPSNGDTVTVGDYTYTFLSSATAVVNTPFGVLIGANPIATGVNFCGALTLDYGTSQNIGVNYGNETSINPAVNSSAPSVDAPNTTITGVASSPPNAFVQVVAPTYGAGYNETPVATSNSAHFFWSNVADPPSFTAPYATNFMLGGTNPVFDNAIGSPDQTWLEFNDPDTNVCRSQVVDDTFDRYYFASPSTIPQYNTYDRIQNGDPAWDLGIPAPGCSPGVTVNGGGDYATLGPQNSLGSATYVGSNYVYLYPITPGGAMQLNSVSFLPNSTNGTVQYAAVLYEDNAIGTLTPTIPGTLLNTGNVTVGTTAAAVATSIFQNPTSLLQDAVYWIGIIIDTSIQIANGDTDNLSVSFASTFLNGPPGTAPNPPNENQTDLVMYGNLATSDVQESRAYVYTWVSAYGEEGPPSPPTVQIGWSNATWTIDLFTPDDADMGVRRNIVNTNIYRTVTGTSGSTVYYFVAQVPVTQAQYVDAALDSVVVDNLQLPSTNYFPPPEGLQGIINMPNGMMAGFQDNEIWFCEPYFPHAWPPAYVITTDFPVVGLGFTLGTLVVMTSATPYTVTGNTPSALAMNKCSLPNPCLSRGSIVSTDYGVFFMSQNGLIQIQNTGIATNLTDSWIGRAQWQQLTPQEYTRAVPIIGQYLCYGSVSPPSVTPVDTSVAQEGFSLQLAPDTSSFTIWPEPGGHRVGFTQMDAPNGFNVNNIEADPWTGIILVVQDGAVYQFDFTNPAPTLQIVDFSTKVYQQTSKRSYAGAKVFFDVPPGTADQTRFPFMSVPSDPAWETLLEDNPGVYGVLFTYLNGNLIDAKEIRNSGQPLRIVSGVKGEFWQWRIKTRCVVSNVQVATSLKELGTV